MTFFPGWWYAMLPITMAIGAAIFIYFINK